MTRFAQLLRGLAVAFAVVGCGPSVAPPPVYPVKGTVTRGGVPYAGATIEFRSKADSRLTMMSVIGPDGSYELFTIVANEKLPGAIEGPCQVTVHPTPAELATPAIDPYPMGDVTIEPKANMFQFEVRPAGTSKKG